MQRILVLAGCLAFGMASNLNASLLVANWTFETSVPFGIGSSNGPYAAESGMSAASSFASGFHASPATTWSNPVGNGSNESYSSNVWLINDYYQFVFPTTGLSNIQLEFDQFSSSTGPLDFKVQWSINGTTFNDVLGGSYSVLTTPSWTSGGGRVSSFTHNFDLSSIVGLNNQASAYVRLTAASSPSSSAGTSRIDNVSVSAVPEPTAILLVGGLLGLAGFKRRRR